MIFEPRTGKTRTSLAIANRRPDVELLFICCPKGVIPVWEKAVAEEYTGTADVEIINFEAMNSKKKRKNYREMCKRQVSLVIIDEAHKIKRRTSKQSKGLRTLVPHTKYRLALTGTSVEKDIVNVWAIFDFINPTVFGKFAQFREEFLVMGGYMGRQVVGFKNLDEFKERMHAHASRIRLTDVADRPIRIRRTLVPIELTPYARKIYDELEVKLFIERRGVKIVAPLAIVLTTRLQQICGGYLCDKDTTVCIDTMKLKQVEKEVKQFHPCVIVCRYRHEMDAIRSRLGGRYSIVVVRGGEPLLTAKPIVDIVLIQTSAGIGIDLSHASTIIFYSWDYSFINYEQMRFRVLSRTQTTARYIFLIVKNSIDEVIYQAAVRKKKLSVAINDYYLESKNERQIE